MTDEPKIYYCPTAGEVEQHPGGGFDVCCDHPELHRAIKWTDLWGIDPNYTKDADEEPTLTASEVKVLTETATRVALELGRRDALEEAAAKLQGLAADPHDVHGDAANGAFLMAAGIVRGMARQDQLPLSQAAGATSDATSGVPGHPEVSEAVRSPQEPPKLVCRRCNGYGLLGAVAGVNPVPCPDCAIGNTP